MAIDTSESWQNRRLQQYSIVAL